MAATIEERCAAIAAAVTSLGADLSAKLRALADANRKAQTDIADMQAAIVAMTEQLNQPEPEPEPAPVPVPEPVPEPEPVPAPAPEPEPQPAPQPEPQPAPQPEPAPAPVVVGVLQPSGLRSPARPGAAKWSKITIPRGQVVHRDGSAYVAPGSSVLAEHSNDWYPELRLDAIAATTLASRGHASPADMAQLEERALQWLRSDLRRTLGTGGSNGVAIYTHVAGLYFAAAELGIDLAGDDLARHTTELTALLGRANFRPNHNFRTGSLLLLASYLAASSITADRDWALWADLWGDHLNTILKVSGPNVVDVHSATHGSGRGMHYTVMSLAGYLAGEAIMRTLSLPRTLPDSLLARAAVTPWPYVITWAKRDTWSSALPFRWVAANGDAYGDNGAVNRDLVSFVSHQAAALGYNVPTYGTPQPTPYWTHTMPLAKS